MKSFAHAWRRLVSRARRSMKPAAKPEYSAWLAERVAARKDRYPLAPAPYRYSVISLVYERSDARFLEEAHASLLAQSLPYFEWVVLAQGTLPAALEATLATLAHEPRVRIVRSDVNLGIIRGMRVCLEAARGDYVVPLDADDLLTEDALQAADHAAHAARRPVFIYSDEDALIGGVPRHPYLRPDWDPLLNWTSSYVWHLCAFDRLTALELGVFSDAGSEYCQDWDTVVRFADAGHTPHHVPEALYHWRQHEASSSNRATATDADNRSLRSTRHLMQARIGRLERPHLYEVAQFPLFRGATEYHVARRHAEPATMDLILLVRTTANGVRTLRAVTEQSDYPIASVLVATPHALGPDDAQAYAGAAGTLAGRLAFAQAASGAAFLEVARRTTADYVLVCSDAIAALHPEACWEALKMFELCTDTALACGRTKDRQGIIVQGATVFGNDALPLFLDAGKPESDAGPYALLLKAHTAGMAHTDIFVAAGDFLRSANVPRAASLAALGMWLGAGAAARGYRVAYSPLTVAEVRSTVLGLKNAQQLEREEKNAFLGAYRTALPAAQLSAQRFLECPALFR